MASNLFTTVFCGSAFGMALTAAGVHRPDVIISQLTLRNFHMLESFLTAAASSIALVTLLQRVGFTNLSPRSYSSIGLFGSLDGNIIGGLIQGAGMALAGSCPGTVFAQVGAGVQSGIYALGGLLVGGILWTGFLQPYLQRPAGKKEIPNTPTSVDQRLGLSRSAAVISIEGIFLSTIALAVSWSAETTRGLVHPVTGGLLIAGAQLLSASTRKTLLGTSTAFEEVGYTFWSLLGSHNKERGTVGYKNVIFVSGMTIGTRLLVWRYPSISAWSPVALNPLRVVTGGVLLAIGSRLSGGCTSGHGISGMSLLSVSSYITVAAMAAGAIGTATALR